MQIAWGNLTLSDGTKAAIQHGLRVGLRGNNQVQPYIRATKVSTYDRKNWRVEIGFRVTRTVASVAEAESFLTTHPEALKLVGKSDMTITKTGGGTLTAKNAILTGWDGRYLGKSIEADYQFIAENFVA